MGAADPTYPLYPVASILAATLLLLVLLTGLIRQNWNLGVTFLCLWLFLENLTNGVGAIVWSDNAKVKFYVYCDIGALDSLSLLYLLAYSSPVSHLKVVTYIAKPMATLVITRRLYMIASLQSVDLFSDASVRTPSAAR